MAGDDLLCTNPTTPRVGSFTSAAKLRALRMHGAAIIPCPKLMRRPSALQNLEGIINHPCTPEAIMKMMDHPNIIKLFESFEDHRPGSLTVARVPARLR